MHRVHFLAVFVAWKIRLKSAAMEHICFSCHNHPTITAATSEMKQTRNKSVIPLCAHLLHAPARAGMLVEPDMYPVLAQISVPSYDSALVSCLLYGKKRRAIRHNQ